jgi:hypothetical protein
LKSFELKIFVSALKSKPYKGFDFLNRTLLIFPKFFNANRTPK